MLLKGNKFFPLQEVSILKRDEIEENHCLVQYSPFDVRNFFSILTTPLLDVYEPAWYGYYGNTFNRKVLSVVFFQESFDYPGKAVKIKRALSDKNKLFSQ